MKSSIWRVARVLAVLQLVTAVELRAVYVSQWEYFSFDIPPLYWAFVIAAFLFLVLPIAAVAGLLRHRLWGFYPLIAFPLIALYFGAIPVPFVAALSGGFLGGWATAVDLGFVGAGAYLFRAAKRDRDVAD